jgi:hypothetical protein
MQLKQELVEPEAMATPGLGGAMAAEPPKEAMAVADAIQSHSSFRSLVFQVERDTDSHQPMLRVRVQFWRSMRLQGVKSAMSGVQGLATRVWEGAGLLKARSTEAWVKRDALC